MRKEEKRSRRSEEVEKEQSVCCLHLFLPLFFSHTCFRSFRFVALRVRVTSLSSSHGQERLPPPLRFSHRRRRRRRENGERQRRRWRQ